MTKLAKELKSQVKKLLSNGLTYKEIAKNDSQKIKILQKRSKMICPKDQIQMHQSFDNGKPIGGGYSDDNIYETWMFLECKICGRVVKEYYKAEVIDETYLERNKIE